jgi:hypothetical protein
MIEEWREAVGHPKYTVSSLGRIKGPMGIRKLCDHRQGYKLISIVVDGRAKSFHAHRIVANTFIDNPSSLPQVNHIDGDKANNHIENLEWCTSSENIKHAFATGLSHKRSIPVVATSIETSISIILRGGKDMIAKGFTPSLVSKVLHGDRAKHKNHTFERLSV